MVVLLGRARDGALQNGLVRMVYRRERGGLPEERGVGITRGRPGSLPTPCWGQHSEKGFEKKEK